MRAYLLLYHEFNHLGFLTTGSDFDADLQRNVQPVIDGHIYSLRNLVERCLSKLKHSRRLATRYDKTADSFLGFVLVASIRLWIRHFVHTA